MKLPVKPKDDDDRDIIDADGAYVCFANTRESRDYIVQAINSYENFKDIRVIISRLERNRKAERLNSEATSEPTKSFWRGQADKASEVIIWLEQALKDKNAK